MKLAEIEAKDQKKKVGICSVEADTQQVKASSTSQTFTEQVQQVEATASCYECKKGHKTNDPLLKTFLLINDDIPPINDFKNRTKYVSLLEQPHIRVSANGWSFPGCKDCIKQCYGSTPPFECKDGHPTDEPILRYKIDIQIFDGDDSAKFIFSDDTCIDLLGKTSSQLRQQMLDLGFTDTSDYRKDIDDLMGRTFAFRVNWQSHWKQCSVLACLDSKFMVETLQA
ncbi:hypothetical protein L195_g022929 [Trifolium pratense]|uniref:Uncharacterized protein n=1 Tax=Trifolium pratense TaxID=57577 RepID=A0A2K3N9H5_TRIPR|nr:hypothetical protein L195_g022929 [Trifolium pratense]